MSIVRADLRVFRSEVFNDTLSNGGRLSTNEILSDIVGNMFPDAGEAERTAGSQKFRKAYYRNMEVTGLVFYNSLLYEENFTPGEDAVYFFPGTHSDTQNDLTGSEDRYGGSLLDVDASATDTSIDVLVEDELVEIFRNGELIRISDMADIDSAGSEEFVRIHPVTAITNVAAVFTIPLETPLVNSYTAATPTRVESVYEHGDVEPTYNGFIVSTVGSGDYDDTTFPVEMDNQGTIFQNWTLTFSDGTNYTAAGDILGSVGSGTTGGDFSPTNPDSSTPYFILRAAGFSGTYANGDTIVFQTVTGAVPIWHERVIPAGAASYAGNNAVIVFDGESG